MPFAPPKHCPAGHPPFAGRVCPVCEASRRAASEARRPSAQARGYDSAWSRASKGFLASHPNCTGCGAPATVVDHVQPHRGDRRLFWDKSNWAALCTSCHGRKTAGQDGGFGNPCRSGRA